ANIRKEDKLSINGPGIMTAVIRAEQQGAEVVAQRIEQVVEAAHLRIGGREVKVTVAHSSLTFSSKASDGKMTVSGPLLDESLLTVLTEQGAN
ncbi:MAG: hypothetical protein JO215_14865, partial [Ktedonobacteraceae bacterium]|nr:hypothetical protein [Ktedonobacteraceae bacterium]